jgi:hypothetical protein
MRQPALTDGRVGRAFLALPFIVVVAYMLKELYVLMALAGR